MKNTNIIRKSFGLKKEILPTLQAAYESPLINRIKDNGFIYRQGRATVYLAEEFGFCYGVDRAIDYAYETRAKFPDKRIFLTNEIIHNPRVNKKLKEMDVRFLKKSSNHVLDLEDVDANDVVLIPAFGNSTEELSRLQGRGCVLVDTTCGSVMSVWKRVEYYKQDGFTSMIHGKYNHEETQATCSRAEKYLIVRDKTQILKVCDYIEGRGNKEAFLKEFEHTSSKGFDPDTDLSHVGCANQTTMLSGDSLEIADLLKASIEKRYGKSEVNQRFRHFDTICSATQDRQDAVLKLVKKGIDVMIVVGGFNSSNTEHLVEISLNYCPAFHVNDAECILSNEKIQHKKVFSEAIIETSGWLPAGEFNLGVTAGASTPNRVIEEVIQRILEITG